MSYERTSNLEVPRMPEDPEIAAFNASVKRKQRILLIVGLGFGVALATALLVWPDEVREGIKQGAQSIWAFLQWLFGGMRS